MQSNFRFFEFVVGQRFEIVRPGALFSYSNTLETTPGLLILLSDKKSDFYLI